MQHSHDRWRTCGTARRAVRLTAGIYEAGVTGWRECVSESIAEYMDRQKKEDAWRQEYAQLAEKQIHLVFPWEEGFPKKLLTIPDPPYGFFYKGRLPEDTIPSVAVIGARECSEYGRYVAEELGEISWHT